MIFLVSGCEKAPAPPEISGINPSSGGYGTHIVITGKNFAAQTTGNIVTINGIEVEVVSAGETSLTAVVPTLAEGEWPVCVKTDIGETTAGMFNYHWTIYVAGNEFNSSGSNVAKYWKNGSGIILDDGTDTHLTSIAVSDADVCVAGTYSTNIIRGRFWKNNLPGTLTTSSGSGANDILVDGPDIYVAGYETYSGVTDIAKYWKNGTPVTLVDPSSTFFACAYSLSKSGEDLYVAGLVKGVDESDIVATYWKNDNPVYLTDGTQPSSAQDIYVSGNDVYVCGYERNSSDFDVAKYWKNGTSVDLSDGQSNARAYSIACKGTDVYVVGYDGTGARCWKNGVAIQVECNPALTTFKSVYIAGDDVFIAGSEKIDEITPSHAYYWRNGARVSLTDNSRLSVARAICVR
jgi:hypothetical protein